MINKTIQSMGFLSVAALSVALFSGCEVKEVAVARDELNTHFALRDFPPEPVNLYNSQFFLWRNLDSNIRSEVMFRSNDIDNMAVQQRGLEREVKQIEDSSEYKEYVSQDKKLGLKIRLNEDKKKKADKKKDELEKAIAEEQDAEKKKALQEQLDATVQTIEKLVAERSDLDNQVALLKANNAYILEPLAQKRTKAAELDESGRVRLNEIMQRVDFFDINDNKIAVELAFDASSEAVSPRISNWNFKFMNGDTDSTCRSYDYSEAGFCYQMENNVKNFSREFSAAGYVEWAKYTRAGGILEFQVNVAPDSHGVPKEIYKFRLSRRKYDDPEFVFFSGDITRYRNSGPQADRVTYGYAKLANTMK